MVRAIVPVMLLVALLAGGCSQVSDVVFPSSPDEKPAAKPAAQQHPNQTPSGAENRAPQPAQAAPRRPLVVIHFDHPGLEYEQPLYYAVSLALKLRPSVSFDLVSVAPAQNSIEQLTEAADTAHRNAEEVLRSLTSMGLPVSRIRVIAGTAKEARANDVLLFVR